MTEEENGQEKQKDSVTKGVLTSVKSQEVKLLVSSPIWKQFAGTQSGLRVTVRDKSVHNGMRRRIVLASGFSWDELQNHT